MARTQVVVAIIEKNGKFLLGKRSEDKGSSAGLWAAISGQIEPGETEEVALVREVFEEVGLHIKPVVKITEFDTEDGRAHIHWWRVSITDGEAHLHDGENTALIWVTLDEMKKLSPVRLSDFEIFGLIDAAKLVSVGL